jgi:hypothetical protein
MEAENPICKVDSKGTKRWCLNGQLHRTDGPASEHSDGAKYWYLNGKLHRTDGPAVEHSDGAKYWYLNGKLHRTDGPAVEYSDGAKFWYLNGKCRKNPPKSYKNPLQLGDLLVVNNEVNFVGRKEGLACLLFPSNSWVFEWEKTL